MELYEIFNKSAEEMKKIKDPNERIKLLNSNILKWMEGKGDNVKLLQETFQELCEKAGHVSLSQECPELNCYKNVTICHCESWGCDKYDLEL